MAAISVCLITEIAMIMQGTGKLRQTNILHYFLISSLVCYLSAFPNIQQIFRGKNITWRKLAWQEGQWAVLAFQVMPVLGWAKRRLLWEIKVRRAMKSRWHRGLTLQVLVHGGILLIIPFGPKKKGLKYESYSMTLESVNRGCQIYTNLQVSLCDRAWKTTTHQRLDQDWNSELTEVSRNNHRPSSLLCIFQHQAVPSVFRRPQAALNRQLRIGWITRLAENQHTQHSNTCSLHLQHQGALPMNLSSAALQWPWASPKGLGTQGGTVPPGTCTRIMSEYAPQWNMDVVFFVREKKMFLFQDLTCLVRSGEKSLSLFTMGVLLTKQQNMLRNME